MANSIPQPRAKLIYVISSEVRKEVVPLEGEAEGRQEVVLDSMERHS